MIDDLLCSPGVKPVDEVVWSSAKSLKPPGHSSCTRGVLAAVAPEGRYEAVATFDQAFVGQLNRGGLSTAMARA